MNITKLVNDYTECNEFEIKIQDSNVKVYYYDKIINFLTTKITFLKDNKKYDIEGNNLNIQTMYKDFVIISGDIKKITIGN